MMSRDATSWFCNIIWYGASSCTLNTIGEPSMGRAALVGFIIFQPTVEKLLNIEQCFH
jgi:hypothetical protein